MLIPHSEAEAADLVRAAAQNRQTLEIVGTRSKSGLGNIVETEAVLSTTGLTGIVSYNPAEMVMTARAGTPLAEIEAALAENRHMLAFEPPLLNGIYGNEGQGTIGGLFACNLSGPRRIQAGAARDHLLGVRFVNGFGEIVSAGGRVMKNVTGLDLVKLMAGSHGTLGLMTELTFKVLPVPETSATVVLSGLDEEEASWAMAQAFSRSWEVSGAAHLPESCKGRFHDGRLPDGAATLLRIEGLGFSVEERLQRMRTELTGARLAELGHEESVALWREVRDVRPFHADGRARPLWKVSVAPSAGHQLLSALRMQTGVDGYFDWQGGLLWLRMEADAEAELLRGMIQQLGGGHATLMRGTDAERKTIPVFHPEAPAIAALTGRIRQKFDPAGIFNPGRMGQ